jgi:hypothetical protein
MAETEKQVPIFRVAQAPGFATGMHMHPVGTEIAWEVPDGWDEKKWGKHYASYGPSVTFECVNPAAEKLMAAHKKNVAEKNKPVPTEMQALQEQNRAQQAQLSQLMAQILEQNALMRRKLDADDLAREEREEAEIKKKR